MTDEAMSSAVAVIGVDIGKHSCHVVGLDERGAIVRRRAGELELSCGRRGAPYGVTHTHFAIVSGSALAFKSSPCDQPKIPSRSHAFEVRLLTVKASASELDDLGARRESRFKQMAKPPFR